jgi:hypothetical protein
MPSDEQPPGFWNLAKELTIGVWDITKEVGKETREGIKSYSENAKVEAQKHHLKHFEKIKNFEKRAKDEGISEESLVRFIKELGIKQKKPEEPRGSGGLLEGINHNLSMVNESIIESRFEQYIKHFKNYKKIYKEALVRGVLPDGAKEILKDCGFTLIELRSSAAEEIVKDASTSGEDLAKLKKSFGVTQSKLVSPLVPPKNLAGEGSSQENFNQAEEYFKKGNEKESDSKPILSSYFSSLIEKYLSNYQAIERGEILQGNMRPTKGYHDHFRAVCRGEKKAVTIDEQAYMAWKEQDRPPQKDSTETTIDVDLP